jgi:anti-sigma factor RsiW
MRITCREVAELLIDYVDGDLPEARLITVQQHICGCPPCAFYMETYRTTIEATRALPAEPLPAEFEARLRRVLSDWRDE